MNKTKKRIYILGLLLIFVMVTAQQCDTTTQSNPKITDIETRPKQVNQNEEFKVFFTVTNPTVTPFTPYIALDYPTGVEPTDFNIRQNKGQKIALTSIPKLSAKSYSFIFRASINANFGLYPITLALYDKVDSLAPLGTLETAKVEVVEIIQNPTR